MKTQAVLSALGRDRVGVADDLTDALSSRRIHIEDSRMTTLRGRFAMIIQVCGEPEDVTVLDHDLVTLASKLGCQLHMTSLGATRSAARARKYVMEVFSRGPSGMSAVTGVLKRLGINIDDLETGAAPAPWTSKMTFHMKAQITLPASCTVERLRRELHEQERQRDLDVVLKPRLAARKEPGPSPTPV